MSGQWYDMPGDPELAERFQAIKEGLIQPTRCERCDYCKSTKVLDRAIVYDDFVVSMADLPDTTEDEA